MPCLVNPAKVWFFKVMIKKAEKIAALLILALLIIQPSAVLGQVQRGEATKNMPVGNKLAGFEESLRNFQKAKENFVNLKRRRAPEGRNIFQAPAPFEVTSPVSIGETSPNAVEPAKIELLGKMAEVLIERNAELKEKVSNDPFYREGKNIALPSLNNNFSKLQELKREIASVKNQGGVEVLKEKIKNQLQAEKTNEVRKSVVLPHLEKFENQAVRKAEARRGKIAEKIQTLKDAGKNTSRLEMLLRDADLKIGQVKAGLAELKTEIGKPELKTEIETLHNQIGALYQIFEQIAILGNSL